MSFPFIAFFAIFAFFPCSLSAQESSPVVISEVLWAGSDLSTADEWVEIAGLADSSLAGWTLTSVNTSGTEVTIFTFPQQATIAPGQFLIISRYGAAQSRLFNEPAYTTSSMSLPNSKLLLRLRDASGNVMDQVDDGVGNPFAGTNANSPILKASMERLDLGAAGADAANWETAQAADGLDDGAPVRGTPGFARGTVSNGIATEPHAEAISQSSSSSHPSMGALNSSASSCSGLRDPVIHIQSGKTTGTIPLSINIQVMDAGKALTKATCTIDFGDGTGATSCNPPSHAFGAAGEYEILAQVTDQCGTTVERSLAIMALGKASSSKSASSSSAAFTDSVRVPIIGTSTVFLAGVLPNPVGKDRGQEWVELTNGGTTGVILDGWSLHVCSGKTRSLTFGNIELQSGQSQRFTTEESGLQLPNDDCRIELRDPAHVLVSSIAWKHAGEGKVYSPALPVKTLQASVLNVVDGDTLDVLFPVVTVGLKQRERVRLIGINSPELNSKDLLSAAYAQKAKNLVGWLTEGQEVVLEFDTEVRDAYNRLLAYVSFSSGDSLQKTLLREGLATVETRFPFSRRDEFLRAQQEGEEEGLGVWALAKGNDANEEIEENEETVIPEQPSMAAASSDIHHAKPSVIILRASSSSRSSKRSAAPKKTAVKKAPAPKVKYKNVITEPVIDDGRNFSPLADPSLPKEFAGLEELIGAGEPEPEEQARGGSLMTVILSMGSPLLGVAGWMIGRRRIL